MVTRKFLDDLTYEVIGSAIQVHKAMGRGLLESVYHECLKEEFTHRKISFITEMRIPIEYRNKILDIDFRCDFYIERCLVIELNAVQEMSSLFEAQLLTYMKLLKAPKGILINFNCSNIFNEGQKTFVNEYFSALPEF